LHWGITTPPPAGMPQEEGRRAMSNSPAPPVAPAPRANPELFGHEAAEQVLLNAFNSGRLPHAWLIGGPAGIGKATLAYRFARFVLAAGETEVLAAVAAAEVAAAVPDVDSADHNTFLFVPDLVPEPEDLIPSPIANPAPFAESLWLDPRHPVFRRVASGGYQDLITLERRFDDKRGRLKAEIAVDEVREAIRFLHHTTAEGGWRVIVVDGVERLSTSGLNALLKILEEPPPRALLLLLTETPGGLLPTIRSRCRKLSLQPLPDRLVLELLGRYRPELPLDERGALARLAEGSIGRALNLAEAGGLKLYCDLVSLLEKLPQLDVAATHAFADQLARKGNDLGYETTTELLVWWLGRLVRGLARGRFPAEVVAGESAVMARITGDRFGEPALERYLTLWEQTRDRFDEAEYAALDRKQVILNVLADLEAAAG